MVSLQALFLWAYATLGEKVSGHCLAAFTAQAHKQLPHMDANAVAKMLWAFAEFKHRPHAELLRGCEAHAVYHSETFTPEGLVRCCCTFVSMYFM